MIGDLSMLHLYRTDLNDVIFYWRKACRLNIKDHIVLINRHISAIFHNPFGIVYQISLYSKYDLEKVLSVGYNSGLFTTFFLCIPQIAPGMEHIRKCMNNTMISNRNRRMSPLVCTFDNIDNIRYTVHITHLGMAVKLHPFIGRIVHPPGGKIIDFLDDKSASADCQFMIKTVYGYVTLDFDKGSLFGIKTL